MATYSTLSNGAVTQIEAFFGLSVGSPVPLPGGMANSSFLADSGTGLVVITVLDNHDFASACRLAGLMRSLSRTGFVQQVRACRSGPVLMVGRTPVIVKDFVDGRRADRSDISQVGRLLAEVHQVSPPQVVEPGTRRVPTRWSSVIGTDAPGLSETVAQAEATYDELAGMPSGLIHGDLFGDNVVVTPSGGLVALDWETASVGPFVLDIGIAAVAFCRTDNRIDEALVDLLIDGYVAGRRLTIFERGVLPAAIGYASALLAYHRFVRHNRTHPDPSKKDLFVELVDFAASAGDPESSGRDFLIGPPTRGA